MSWEVIYLDYQNLDEGQRLLVDKAIEKVKSNLTAFA